MRVNTGSRDTRNALTQGKDNTALFYTAVTCVYTYPASSSAMISHDALSTHIYTHTSNFITNFCMLLESAYRISINGQIEIEIVLSKRR